MPAVTSNLPSGLNASACGLRPGSSTKVRRREMLIDRRFKAVRAAANGFSRGVVVRRQFRSPGRIQKEKHGKTTMLAKFLMRLFDGILETSDWLSI